MRLRVLEQSLRSTQDRVARTEVRAPVKGTVQIVTINTVGGIIQPGMDLVKIVPFEDQLLIEARVRPSDIAFLFPGQEAKVKLTAYDFGVFGALDAVLEFISADTIVDERGDSYYRIRVRTARSFLGTRPSLWKSCPAWSPGWTSSPARKPCSTTCSSPSSRPGKTP